MKKLLMLAAATMLFATNANAVLYTIDATAQNGNDYAPGFGSPGGATLGFVGWFTIGTNGGGNQAIIGSTGSAPGYACYGLSLGGFENCADAGATEIWDPNQVVFSGSINTTADGSDATFLDLSWTGQSGSEVPFGIVSLFSSSVLSGSYDADGNISGGNNAGAGYDAEGFSCWNNPINGLPGPPDFCGNGTGTTNTGPFTPQTKFNRELPLGVTLVTDNGDGTLTIDMGDATYADCVASGGCTPGSNSSDVFAQWRVNVSVAAIPVPAAVWLFGSALGLLGWLRRRASV